MTQAEEIATLKAENDRLRARANALTLKVSEKGAVSVYGMGRFPVTLYQEQWVKVLDKAEDIRAFIVANKGRLAKKD